MPGYGVDDCPICGEAKMERSEMCSPCRNIVRRREGRDKRTLKKLEQEEIDQFYRALAEDKAIREAFGDE